MQPMTSNDLKAIMRKQGRADALDLAQRAGAIDGTAIIAEEQKIPLFVSGADLSDCPSGTPIAESVDG